jgi:hypothetical protein
MDTKKKYNPDLELIASASVITIILFILDVFVGAPSHLSILIVVFMAINIHGHIQDYARRKQEYKESINVVEPKEKEQLKRTINVLIMCTLHYI